MNDFLLLLNLGYQHRRKDHGFETYDTYTYMGENGLPFIIIEITYDIRFNYVDLGIQKQSERLLSTFDGIVTVNRYPFTGIEEYMKRSAEIRKSYIEKKRYNGGDLKVELLNVCEEFLSVNIKQLHKS